MVTDHNCNLKTFIVPHRMSIIPLWNPIPVFGRKHNSICYLVQPATVTSELYCTYQFVLLHDCFLIAFLTTTVFVTVGRWNVTGMVLVVRNLTTLLWTLVVLVQRLTLLLGLDPHLPMRLPSRPHVALHICGVHTQTHTWRQSPCLDSQERSVLRCDAG